MAHAQEQGLSAVGITDHDTIGGWDEAMEAGRRLGVEVVPGVEFSVEDENGRFHLLGYYVDRQSHLVSQLAQLQHERAARNEKMYARLAEIGKPLDPARVREIAGPDAQIGRPHIAQAMLEAGHVATLQEAFDKYLASGGPAYLPKKVLTAQQVIEGIREAGGISVWAHPPFDRGKRSWDDYEAIMRRFVELGLRGVETYYWTYNAEEAAHMRAWAKRYNLLESGGSDFHGARKPNQLGTTQLGPVPDDVLTALKARIKVL
ncbi:MAG: 3,5-nucleoside bisphosphate phosphatase [Abditibacteriota bacterium]|nr:3,5-nucleoside bisphosphate phosphatase [Abditibacteriota bacterium]